MKEETNHFQLTIIGAGPGGYSAAIRASQLGYRVLLIEREKLGGVCLNWGCIPTKALLDSAHRLEQIKRAQDFGIHVKDVTPDFPGIIARSRSIAGEMEKGVQHLIKKNNIRVIKGSAKFLTANRLSIETAEGNREIESDFIIIATGSKPRSLPDIKFNEKNIISYREAMTLDKLPERLCIIGGGAIGIEFADFFTSMGSHVTLLEIFPRIVPGGDEEISNFLCKTFESRGIKIFTNTSIIKAGEEKNNNLSLTWETDNKKNQTEIFDKILIATGVTGNIDSLHINKLKISLDKDRIIVNDRYKTNINSVYAIGDCIPGPALAHLAAMEGIRAAEAIHIEMNPNASNTYEPINYSIIPTCIYCNPEIAAMGLTEQAAARQGIAIKTGRFPFSANGRARALGEARGFVKVLAGAEYGELLGAHIIGPGASEIITEFTLGAAMELVMEDFSRTIHPHPTLSEIVMEATATVLGESINI